METDDSDGRPMTPPRWALLSRLGDVGLVLVGLALIVVGTAAWSGAAALLVAGVALVGAGVWPWPFSRPR